MKPVFTTRGKKRNYYYYCHKDTRRDKNAARSERSVSPPSKIRSRNRSGKFSTPRSSWKSLRKNRPDHSAEVLINFQKPRKIPKSAMTCSSLDAYLEISDALWRCADERLWSKIFQHCTAAVGSCRHSPFKLEMALCGDRIEVVLNDSDGNAEPAPNICSMMESGTYFISFREAV